LAEVGDAGASVFAAFDSAAASGGISGRVWNSGTSGSTTSGRSFSFSSSWRRWQLIRRLVRLPGFLEHRRIDVVDACVGGLACRLGLVGGKQLERLLRETDDPVDQRVGDQAGRERDQDQDGRAGSVATTCSR